MFRISSSRLPRVPFGFGAGTALVAGPDLDIGGGGGGGGGGGAGGPPELGFEFQKSLGSGGGGGGGGAGGACPRLSITTVDERS